MKMELAYMVLVYISLISRINAEGIINIQLGSILDEVGTMKQVSSTIDVYIRINRPSSPKVRTVLISADKCHDTYQTYIQNIREPVENLSDQIPQANELYELCKVFETIEQTHNSFVREQIGLIRKERDRIEQLFPAVSDEEDRKPRFWEYIQKGVAQIFGLTRKSDFKQLRYTVVTDHEMIRRHDEQLQQVTAAMIQQVNATDDALSKLANYTSQTRRQLRAFAERTGTRIAVVETGVNQVVKYFKLSDMLILDLVGRAGLYRDLLIDYQIRVTETG